MTTTALEMTRDDVMRETLEHVRRVAELMLDAVEQLQRRAVRHDDSKFSPEEFESFVRETPGLKALTYGSPEYKAALERIRPAIKTHYLRNRHHPEHFCWRCPVCNLRITDEEKNRQNTPEGPNDSGVKYCPSCCDFGMIYESELIHDEGGGIEGMTLIDLIEMLADWRAATERHTDGNLRRSIIQNKERFGYDGNMARMLTRTAKSLGWIK